MMQGDLKLMKIINLNENSASLNAGSVLVSVKILKLRSTSSSFIPINLKEYIDY